MPTARWNGHVIAQTDRFEVVEGNIYFPPDSLRREFFAESATHTTCHWKGEASYFDLRVGGQENKDAAWYYPAPLPAAENIRGFVAFWRGVEVSRE